MINHATGCNEPNADDRKLEDQSVQQIKCKEKEVGGQGGTKGGGTHRLKET